MKAVAVIPARFGSTRLAAKALLRDTGKYLVQHVYESVSACATLDRVIIATDDERIAQAVRSFGGDVCLTRADHESGTDRVAEAAEQLGLADDDVVLNVQGDEPEVSPDVPAAVVNALISQAGSCSIATVAAPFADDGPKEGPGSPLDPHRVKVVVDAAGRALYFSRSLIPYPREAGGRVDRPSRWLLHMGVYGFRCSTLREIAHPKPAETMSGGACGSRSAHGAGALDRVESLEQLRWMTAGHRIAVAIVDHRFVGIDTPEDYAAFVQRMSQRQDVRRGSVLHREKKAAPLTKGR